MYRSLRVKNMRKILMLLTLSFVFSLSIVRAQTDLLYVASPDTNAILVINPADASVADVIELEASPFAVLTHPDSGHLFAATDNGLTVIDAEDYAIVDNLEFDGQPTELWADEGLIYVSLDNGDEVALDAETLERQEVDEPAEAAPQSRPRRMVPLFLPASPLCPLNADAPRHIFQTNLPPGLIDVQCRVLAVNGEFTQNPGEIGIQAIIDLGVIHAVEVFSPSGANMGGIDFCLPGRGQVIYLDAEGQPREPQILRATQQFAYTCFQLPGAGTIVLVA
jgi:hypothetical protein